MGDPFRIDDGGEVNPATAATERCRFSPCAACGEPVMRLNTLGDQLAGPDIRCRICVEASEGRDGKASAETRNALLKNFLAMHNGELRDF